MGTLAFVRSSLCSHECEHGTHECVRHILPQTCSSSTSVLIRSHLLSRARKGAQRNRLFSTLPVECARTSKVSGKGFQTAFLMNPGGKSGSFGRDVSRAEPSFRNVRDGRSRTN
jgi:hypothetical protein